MKPCQKLVVAFVAIVLCACVVSPAVKPLVDRAVPKSKTLVKKLHYDEDTKTYEFGKVFRRMLMLSAVIVLVAASRTLEIGSMARLGYRRTGGALRNLGMGVLIGLISMAAFMAVLHSMGAVIGKADRSAAKLLPEFAVFLLQAVLIGLFEETLFRGVVLQTLMRDMRFRLAAILSSVLYSLLHFFEADVPVQTGTDVLVGFRALGVCFLPLVSDPAIIPAVLGLFLLGMVFAYAYRWTQALYLPIALHASWVFALKVSGKLFHLGAGAPAWLYGSKQIVDGVLGCVFLLAVFGLLWVLECRCVRADRRAEERG